MNFTKISFIILFIALFTSCTIKQEFYFNKDFSGHYSSSIDLSQFIQAMSAMDTTEKGMSHFMDSVNLIMDETIDKIEANGISNLKSGVNNDVFYISYDFADIDALNKALNDSEMKEIKPENGEFFIYFTRKGKTLIYHGMPKIASSDDQKIKEMKDYYKYEVRLEFERKIKKSNNPNYQISEDKHSAVLKSNFIDVSKKGFNSEVKFRLK